AAGASARTGAAMRKGPAPAAVACGCAVALCARAAFAASVPSVPQAGHVTGEGTRPLTGSTSNWYRCPQLHCILMGTIARSAKLLFDDLRDDEKAASLGRRVAKGLLVAQRGTDFVRTGHIDQRESVRGRFDASHVHFL